MNTNEISCLCKLSDRIKDNAETANGPNFRKGIKSLVINANFGHLTIDFDDYPELKQVGEKLLDYLVKSENSKQNEIKIEIAKRL